MADMTGGNLLIIGGAEEKNVKGTILQEFFELSGGKEARIAVITTASEKGREAGAPYEAVFGKMGAGRIDIFDINSRHIADNQSDSDLSDKYSGIFFTGGDQLRLTSILGGTKTFYALHEAHRKGIIIAGTSAGASAMSGTMIIDGLDNEAARKCTLKMAPGLGLLGEVLIDQHFHQRGRIGRLLCGVAENPFILGIGIDEDTAIRTYPDGHLEVLGSNSVTIVDGRKIKSSNVSELLPDENLSIANVIVHLLPAGYGFDLKAREVLRLKPNLKGI